MSVRLSVCPHATTLLPLYRFSWNLILQYFSKICLENSSIIKIWQEKQVLYMKTNIHFLSHLTQFFSEWGMSQTKVVEKIITYILCSMTFLKKKSCLLWNNVENHYRAGQATDDNLGHAHCMLDKQDYKYKLTECNTYCLSIAKGFAGTRLNFTLYEYTHIICLVWLFLVHNAMFILAIQHVCMNQ